MKKYFHPKFKNYAFDKKGNAYVLVDGILKENPKFVNSRGYYDVEIYHNKQRYKKRLHRLLYEAVTGKSLGTYRFTRNSMTIDHKNSDKLDNRWSNLTLIPLTDNVRKYCKENGMHLFEDPNKHTIRDNNSESDIRYMRENSRDLMKSYYKENKKEMREYNKEYMKKYFEDPVNYQCHRIRCLIRCVMKNRGLKKGKHDNITSKIVPLLADIKPNEKISYKIPLFHLMRFNDKLPWEIALDPRNLELVESVDRYNYINDESIRVAKELEVIYKECKGLTAYLQKIKPQFTKKAA